MSYEILVLDLDGTLTNSEKKITPATKKSLTRLLQSGKHVVLASGRPTPGVLPLANELNLAAYGGYILSFNGACITNCRTQQVIYSKLVPSEYIASLYQYFTDIDVNMIAYTDTEIISAFEPNEETYIESRINNMPVRKVDDFVSCVTTDFPISKLLITGKPELIANIETELKAKFHTALNIFRSEPYFLEIMAQNIDKAHSLQRLLSSLNLTADEMICCGDGYNDITMIEYAGLGVAMANAQTAVLDIADYVTHSNDDEGILHVIEKFLL